MSSIYGKALLVITRLHEEGESRHFDVHSFIQSCSGREEHRDEANDNFQHLEYDVLPLPGPAYKLAPGETLRVSVGFEFSYYQCGEYGEEVDVDLDYRAVRVRRRQKPQMRYISKENRQ